MKRLFKKFYVLLALSFLATNLLTVGIYANTPNSKGEPAPCNIIDDIEIY